jgi:hypothetical protein
MSLLHDKYFIVIKYEIEMGRTHSTYSGKKKATHITCFVRKHDEDLVCEVKVSLE